MELDSLETTAAPAHPRGAWRTDPARQAAMVRVCIWTGHEAAALRHAQRLSLRSFAKRLGVSARMVSVRESRGRSIQPRLFTQGVLDAALRQSDAEVQARFLLLLSVSQNSSWPTV